MSAPVVHLLRETRQAKVTTKCGLVGDYRKIATTSWSSDVTCAACKAGR